MHTGKLVWCLCLAIPMLLTGQNDYTIAFHAGSPPASAYFKPAFVNAAHLEDATFNGKSYLLLQFEEIPGEAAIEQLRLSGVELLHYMPNYTFWASVPLNTDLTAVVGLKAVLLPRAAWKLSADLVRQDYPVHALSDLGIHLQAVPYGNIPPALLADSLTSMGYSPVETFADRVELRIPIDCIKQLASHPGILFLAPVDTPSFSEGIAGRSLIRSNLLGMGPNLGMNGEGVSVAIADDGVVSHIDFKGRLQAYTALNTGSHGDMTAGLLVGAGNKNPSAMGMAPGAFLHLYSINDYIHINNAVDNYAMLRTVITSTSYGDGCGGVYSLAAMKLDEQVLLQRELLHIFSAGNFAQQACGIYGALGSHLGARYGNITGGRKAAKHALVVGNLYYNDSLRINSSRGPLNDGILKPDLVAPGQGLPTTGPDHSYQLSGGTSAAAPVVAGLAAQLYQAYRLANGGADPTFAHIKAAMFNTAEDLGRPGPDYDNGWGRPHGGRALKVIQNQWFLTGTVNHQGQNLHTIQVPNGTRQLRVMIYWLDPAATLNAAKTLVNDLDLSITSPSNVTFKPWVLSKAAHIDSIVKPAYRGIDRVNVAEQVTIDNPQAGAYQIKVNGYLVPKGPQDYIISYYFEDQVLSVTYPNGAESLVPGENEVIRWDAAGTAGNFRLEFSPDSMATWQTLANDIPGNRRYYDWTVPNVVTGKAYFRISRNGFSDTSDHAFHMIGLPNFHIRNAGSSHARIHWTPVPGANKYTVYAAGERYMEPVGVTTDTSFLIPVQPYMENWYSVSAGYNNSISGRRAQAKSYLHLPCQVTLEVKIKFDQFPAETRWEIRNSSGMVLVSGGPYAGNTPHSIVSETVCLPYGCFDFVIYDGYHDGLCCQNGEGYYELKNTTGQVLVSGSQFGSMDIRPFCLNNPGQPLSASAYVVQHASCNGSADAIASVLVNQGMGMYTFLWSHGPTSQTVSNLVAGAYTVTVSDGQSQVVSSVVVTQPQPLGLNLEYETVHCAGGHDGIANVAASGGTAPYTYLWSNGQLGSTATGLESGVYTVTATDSKGCRKEAGFVLGEPDALVVVSVVSAASQGANGSVQLTVSGGTTPYQFLWSSGATSQNISGLNPGQYQVTVTDANQCTAAHEVQVGGGMGNAAYCTARGASTSFEWIQSVQVGSLQHTSGNDGGYGDFTHLTATLTEGATHPVILQPAYAGNHYTEYWSIWIDLNRDNDFEDAGELVFATSGIGQVQGAFTLPGSFLPGTTRMRVAMRYGSHADPCSSFPYGEVEDYTAVLSHMPLLAYCNAQASNASQRWIQRVQLGSIVNESGSNGGYADFTQMVASAGAGGALEVMLYPGTSNNTGGERWRIWMDFNRDGDFEDPGEQVLSVNLGNTMIHATVYLPAGILPGPTRIRVAMRWNGWPSPCGTFDAGEVEDYTLNIFQNMDSEEGDISGIRSAENAGAAIAGGFEPWDGVSKQAGILRIAPNPAREWTNLSFFSDSRESVRMLLIAPSGKIIRKWLHETSPGDNHLPLSLAGLPPGVYQVRMSTLAGVLRQQLVVAGAGTKRG